MEVLDEYGFELCNTELLIKYVLKSWKKVIVIVVVCGLISFGYASFFIPKLYHSSGSIYIEPKINYDGEVESFNGDSLDRMTKLFVHKIQSDEILEETAKRMESELTVNDIRNSLSVDILEDNNIISISANSNNAEQARCIVDNVINVFLIT